MRAVLLCAGPSLVAAPRAFDAPLVAAINRAALIRRCHLWACGDWSLIEEIRDQVEAFQTPALPRLLTDANSHIHLRERTPSGDWLGGVDEIQTLFDGRQETSRWHFFTATAALWHVAHRIGDGATIDVYGADWTNEAYCDGAPISDSRIHFDTWQLEQTIWNGICEHLRKRSIAVIRHGIGGAPAAMLADPLYGWCRSAKLFRFRRSLRRSLREK